MKNVQSWKTFVRDKLVNYFALYRIQWDYNVCTIKGLNEYCKNAPDALHLFGKTFVSMKTCSCVI